MQLPIEPNPAGSPPRDASDQEFAFGPEHTPFDALGGDEALSDLVKTFYDTMDRDERFAGIRGLHQKDLTSAREKLFDFLSGWLGGPQRYIEKHGHPRLRGRHMPFPIGADERDQWLEAMALSLDARGVTGEIRTFLDARFQHVANFMRNQDAS